MVKQLLQRVKAFILRSHAAYPEATSLVLAFIFLMSITLIFWLVIVIAGLLMLWDPYIGFYLILTILGMILLHINFRR